MHFQFNMFNHNATGQRSLEDPVKIISHQLRALGHTSNLHNNTFIHKDSGYNVLIEGFTPMTLAKIEEGYASGARFLFVATEEPTPKGFNHGGDTGMVERQKIFPRAAVFADAIFALVPGAEAWFSQFAPSYAIELGYAPTLVRANRQEPDHDFGFYGSLSTRRYRVLKRLARKMATQNAVKVLANFSDGDYRDHEMRRCRVLLQVRLTEKMGLVSSSRCNTAMHIGRPVVAEPHALSYPWNQVVHFSESIDAFYTDAVRIRAVWRSVHDRQFEAFKRLMTPQKCIGDALGQVLASRQAA